MKVNAASALIAAVILSTLGAPHLVCRPAHAQTAAYANPADDLVNKGKQLFAKGDKKGALAAYAEALRLDPQSAVAYRARAQLKFDTNDLDGALSDFDAALSLQPTDVYGLCARAAVKEDKGGDTLGALQDYNEALKINPDFVEARFNRARRLSIQGRKEDNDPGIADCDFCIKQGFHVSDSLGLRAGFGRGNGDLKGAVVDAKQAVSLDPKSYLGWCSMAACDAELGNYDEAYHALEQGEKANPKSVMINVEFAKILNAKGMHTEAFAILTHATALKPNDLDAFFNLGFAQFAIGRPDLAEITFRRIIDTNPADGAAWLNLGDAQRQQGKFDLARKTLEHAREFAPASVKEYLARVDAKSGEDTPFLSGNFDTLVDFDGKDLPATMNIGYFSNGIYPTHWKCLSGLTVDGIGMRGGSRQMGLVYETPDNLVVEICRTIKGKQYLMITGTGRQLKGKVIKRWISKDSPTEPPADLTAVMDVCHDYAITGNDGATQYKGSLTVSKNGESYTAKWKFDDGTTFSGPAILSGPCFAAAFRNKLNKPAIKTYSIRTNGDMYANWLYYGNKMPNKEKAIRQK